MYERLYEKFPACSNIHRCSFVGVCGLSFLLENMHIETECHTYRSRDCSNQPSRRNISLVANYS